MNLYKLIFKIIFIIFIVFSLFFKENLSLYAKKISDKKIPNIIIIMLNGVRNIESIEDPTHQYIPNLWNKMRREGVLYTNLVNLNSEFHVPAADAVITGKNYPFYRRINTPSIFQYIRKKYALPANRLWSIGNWYYNDRVYEADDYSKDTYPSQMSMPQLKLSAELESVLTKQETMFIEFFKEFRRLEIIKSLYFYIHWDSMDEVYYRVFKRVIEKFKPKFIFYMPMATDSAHYGTFSRYTLALKHNDERIFEIWQMINRDPFYKDNTYLVVCPDHGRNLYYRHHNENTYNNPSSVWMYIYGPDIKKGVIVDRIVHHIDIFSTLAYIMDIETEASEGRILQDCFRKNAFSDS